MYAVVLFWFLRILVEQWNHVYVILCNSGADRLGCGSADGSGWDTDSLRYQAIPSGQWSLTRCLQPGNFEIMFCVGQYSYAGNFQENKNSATE